MSAAEIPDLRSLLHGSRPPRRGAVRAGRRPGARGQVVVDDSGGSDKIVQQTDNDASRSRVSAVDAGYLDDPFAHAFLDSGGRHDQRFPIINRGTYVRTCAIDGLVDRFLEAKPHGITNVKWKRKQIVSLGAGSDTRWFRIASRPSASRSSSTGLVYHELDFPTNTARKIDSIRRSSHLMSVLQSGQSNLSDVEISQDGSRLLSSTYNLHPIDLRTLQPPNTSNPRPPVIPNLDPSLPTLLISECCLIYLSPSQADAILEYFVRHVFSSSHFTSSSSSSSSPFSAPLTAPLGIVLYEPIRPSDPFGKVMVSNLARRGIFLQTLQRYSSLRKQKGRLERLGFKTGQGAADIDYVFEHWLAQQERERVARLEMLDEVEEWRLLARHYCVAWAWGEGGEEVARSQGDTILEKVAGLESERENEHGLTSIPVKQGDERVHEDFLAAWKEELLDQPIDPKNDDDADDGQG